MNASGSPRPDVSGERPQKRLCIIAHMLRTKCFTQIRKHFGEIEDTRFCCLERGQNVKNKSCETNTQVVTTLTATHERRCLNVRKCDLTDFHLEHTGLLLITTIYGFDMYSSHRLRFFFVIVFGILLTWSLYGIIFRKKFTSISFIFVTTYVSLYTRSFVFLLKLPLRSMKCMTSTNYAFNYSRLPTLHCAPTFV